MTRLEHDDGVSPEHPGIGRLHYAVVAVAAGALWISPGTLAGQDRADFRSSPFLRVDPEKTVLAERDSRVPCGECHASEYEVWRQTKHATGFDNMHRSESARDILARMGLRVTKRQESLCMRCHYTVGPQLRAIAGVSCESCHGPARDWLEVHNTWGDGVKHPDQEAPQHRTERIARSEAGGMLRPTGDLYAVAANCFECHTVPLEELVNRGGHTTGGRFDLVERTTKISHNFVQEQWGGERGNRPSTPERTRLLFGVGRILAYESAIRGVAEATAPDRYFKAMESRAQRSYQELEAIGRAVTIPEVTDILRLGANLRLVPGNRASLIEAADRIRAVGRRFASTANGSRLEALDPILAGEAPADIGAAEPPPGDPPPGEAPAAAPTAPTGAAAPTPSPAAGATIPELPGKPRQRPAWFPAPDGRYKTTLPGCSCHDRAEDWLAQDPHDRSAVRLMNREPKARTIATLYFGGRPEQMARGNQICASCHGTIESAAPNVDVRSGVSCESCHGPSSGYLDPHEEGGNPQLGMVDLKNDQVRAKTCAACHRISDDRLIAAGHSSGENFDLAQAHQRIVHFPDRRVDRGRQRRGEGAYRETSAAQLSAAFAAEARGRPIPQVTVVALPSRPPAAAPPQPAEPARQRISPGEVKSREEAPMTSLPPTPRPVRRPVEQATARLELDLGPLPSPADSLTSEELLLLVKRRLDRVDALLRRRN